MTSDYPKLIYFENSFYQRAVFHYSTIIYHYSRAITKYP